MQSQSQDQQQGNGKVEEHELEQLIVEETKNDTGTSYNSNSTTPVNQLSAPAESTITKTKGSNHVRPPVQSRDQVRSWLSWKLENPLWITFVLVIEIGIIATIVTLDVLSIKNHGFVSVQNTPLLQGNSPISKLFASQSLLWTTLPVLLMTFFRIIWDMVVSASEQRQPFVDLGRSKEKAVSAQRTIMLDYQTVSSLYNWIVAFNNRHIHLCCTFLLALALSIVPSLTAHLFQPISVALNSTVPFTLNYAFNSSAFASSFDLRPVYDDASATKIYGGTPPPWTTFEYSFQPFMLANRIPDGNTTANVTAYSSYLNCVAIPSSACEIIYSSGSGSEGINVYTTDRGCPISTKQELSSITPLYGKTFSVQNCSYDSGSTRIGMLSGRYDTNSSIHISNFSILSCTSSYWETPGYLTVSWSPDQSPDFVDFAADNQNAVQIVPDFTRAFENLLHETSVFDPSAIAFQDDFARLVYTYASKLNGSNPLYPDTMATAMTEMFSSVYAILASTQIFQPAPSTALSGFLSVSETRLFVVSPIAWTIVAVMILVLACTIVLFIYARRKNSILLEEPVGLLGHATLLERSDVAGLVARMRRDPQCKEKLVGYIDQHYDMAKTPCYLEGASILDGHIVVGDPVERKSLGFWKGLMMRLTCHGGNDAYA